MQWDLTLSKGGPKVPVTIDGFGEYLDALGAGLIVVGAEDDWEAMSKGGSNWWEQTYGTGRRENSCLNGEDDHNHKKKGRTHVHESGIALSNATVILCQ